MAVGLAFDGTAGSGPVPDTEHFDATASRSLDPMAQIVSYAWDFGDGSTGSGAKASHTYANAGSYTATVVVTDSNGDSAKGSLSVSVAASTIRVVATVEDGDAPFIKTFDATASSSSDPSSPLTCRWVFGDPNSFTQGCKVSWTFWRAGQYAVDLYISDGHHGVASKTLNVTISAAPWSEHFASLPALVVNGIGALFASVREPSGDRAFRSEVYALGPDGPQDAFTLAEQEVEGDLPDLVSADEWRVFGFGVRNTSGGPAPYFDSALFSGSGNETEWSGTDANRAAPAVFANGDSVMDDGVWSQARLTKRDGANVIWSVPLPAGVALDALNFAVTPSITDILVAGHASGPWEGFGHSFSGGPFLLELDPAGALLWARELSGASGHFTSMSSSVSGAIALTGHLSGSYAWTDSGPTGDVLLTANADGSPRWARALPDSIDGMWKLAAEFDRMAVYALTPQPGCGASGSLLEFDGTGNPLRSLTVQPKDCADALHLGTIVYSWQGLAISGLAESGTNLSAPGGFVAQLAP